MSVQLTRRAVKLLGILLIISFCGNYCFAQKTQKSLDSVALKKELDGVLAKYGLKTTGFAINVISLNQKGGQTAYSITNNYYGDTTNIATNFAFDTLTEGGKKYLFFWPKKGVWENFFVAWDSLKNDVLFDIGSGFFSSSSLLFNNPNDNTLHTLTIVSKSAVCSKSMPIKVQLLKHDAFVVFGNAADLEKIYFYQKGKVVYIPYKE